jgi:hypothetical protein
VLSVQRNVWFLGLTSLLTDMSSEMVAAIQRLERTGSSFFVPRGHPR